MVQYVLHKAYRAPQTCPHFICREIIGAMRGFFTPLTSSEIYQGCRTPSERSEFSESSSEPSLSPSSSAREIYEGLRTPDLSELSFRSADNERVVDVANNGFYKKLCTRMFPELKCCSCVVEQNNLTRPSEVGRSNFNEQDATAMEDRVFALLARELKSTIRKDDCILAAICASSTDNDPDESIENTLDSSDVVDRRPSYWSSEGTSNPEVPETLTYRLCSKLCIIEEVNIRPFKAFFQSGRPIYSAEAVRFRLGFSKKPIYSLSHAEEEVVAAERFDDDDGYIWTYVSPRFPMVQENCLQTFKLPQLVLCIGGILQIELLGRVQKQKTDGQYYICMRYVQVKGRPLPPVFDVQMSAAKTCLLKYCPQTDCSSSPSAAGDDANPTSSGGWQALAARIRQSGKLGAMPCWGT